MRPFWLVVFCAAISATRCGKGEVSLTDDCPDGRCAVGQACESNLDCVTGALCKPQMGSVYGLCICRDDVACGAGEECNSQGVCQERADCETNDECDAGSFCNLVDGQCMESPGQNCGADVHCAPGFICEPEAKLCIPGCFDDADCPLYAPCERPGFGVGRCEQGRCSDPSFCPFGFSCINNECVAPPDNRHCAQCSPRTTSQQPPPCGEDNYCLVNNAYDPNDNSSGSEFYCGLSCEDAEDCPSGYNCNGVILLTQDLCESNSECGGGGRRCIIAQENARTGFCTCITDDECTRDQAAPLCMGRCFDGVTPCLENADCVVGDCEVAQKTCLTPADQPCTQHEQCDETDICVDMGGVFGKICLFTDPTQSCNTNEDCICTPSGCFGTGRSCTTPADCRLSCENGGCALGAACGPAPGLNCPDVTPN